MTITSKVPILALALAAAAAALALLAWSPAAHAGGWAVTTLDPLSAAPQAGTTLTVGYTVLQHGVTPVAVDGTGIAIVGADGTRTVFPGRPAGPTGHYVADVRFPVAGASRWEAEQGWFGPQQLGAVPVAAGAPSASADVTPAPVAASGDGPGAGAWALLAATLAAAVLLGARALTLVRRRTHGEPAA